MNLMSLTHVGFIPATFLDKSRQGDVGYCSFSANLSNGIGSKYPSNMVMHNARTVTRKKHLWSRMIDPPVFRVLLNRNFDRIPCRRRNVVRKKYLDSFGIKNKSNGVRTIDAFSLVLVLTSVLKLVVLCYFDLKVAQIVLLSCFRSLCI